QRSGVLDLLRAVRVGPAMQNSTRSKLLLEVGILGIIGILRFLLGVQVIEVAEKFVEPVHCRKELVPVAQMVLAELPGHIAERLQDLGDCGVFRSQSEIRARKADFSKAGADRGLARDE